MSLVEKFQVFMTAVNQDFPASLQMLSDDIRWINRMPGNVPFGGDYHGKEEVVRYFTLMSETFIIGEHDLSEFDFIESGNKLVMVGCEKNGKVIPTGKTVDLEFVWVIHFDDSGKISYLREHNDTAAMGEAFQP